MDDASETARLLEAAPGGRDLLNWFSGSPNFGDCEVVALHLNREGSSTLEIRLARDDEPIAVTFFLGHWIDVRLTGFSHQNVLEGIKLKCAGDREIAPWEEGVGCAPGQIEIELEPCFGASGVIRATLLSVSMRKL